MGVKAEDWSPCPYRYENKLGWRTDMVRTGLLLDNEAVQSTMEVDFLRLPNNELCLFYCKKNSNDDCRVMMRKSKDDGDHLE